MFSALLSCDNNEGFIKNYRKSSEKLGTKDNNLKQDDPLDNITKRLDDYDKKNFNDNIQELDQKLSNGEKICPANTTQIENELPNKGKTIWCEISLTELKGVKEGPYIELDDKGKKIVQGYYFNGRRDSTWTFYNSRLNKFEEFSYKAGKREGKFTSWFDNNKVKEEGTFSNDIKDGIWLNYDTDGKKIFSYEFKNGRKNGKAEKYFDNGNVEFSGSFANNLEDGKWTYFYKSGVIKSAGSFEKGKKIGLWQEYSTDSKLISTRDYSLINQINKTIKDKNMKLDSL